MALPTTGDTWANVLEDTLNPLNVRKGIITDIIVADYLNADGTVRNLADPAAGLNSNGVFTPFAADGQIRKDLLFGSSGGSFVGGYHTGYLKESGWTLTPNITVDKTPVAQTIWSVRNDVTGADCEIMFTNAESTVLNDYLFMDLPLVNGIPDEGTSNYSLAAPLGNNLTERIVIALGVDGANLFAVTLPRCSRKKVGKWEAQRKNAMETDHTYEAVVDPYTKTPFIISRGGLAWAASGGVPIFGIVAPTATAVTGLKATIAFPTPTGLDVGSMTYTVTKTTGGTPSSATLVGLPVVSGGTTTITVGSLTASTAYTFTVTGVGSNGGTATSLASNSITAIA